MEVDVAATVAGVLALREGIAYMVARHNRKNGNPGPLHAMQTSLNNIDQTLDVMGKDIAIIKDRTSK